MLLFWCISGIIQDLHCLSLIPQPLDINRDENELFQIAKYGQEIRYF